MATGGWSRISKKSRKSEEDAGLGLGTTVAIGAAVALGAALAYGAKKLYDVLSEEGPRAECSHGSCSSEPDLSQSSYVVQNSNENYTFSTKEQNTPPGSEITSLSLADHLSRYYRQHVKIPRSEIESIRHIVNDVNAKILNYFMVSHPELEVLDVVCHSDDLEGLHAVNISKLDVLVLFNLDKHKWNLQRSSVNPLCYHVTQVKSDGRASVYDNCTVDGRLSTIKVCDQLMEHFCIEFQGSVKSYQSEPIKKDSSVTLSIVGDSGQSLTINLVPAIRLQDILITATSSPTTTEQDMWQESFLDREMQKLSSMDATRCCHLKCISIMKAVALNYPCEFGMLPPDVYKTVIMHMMTDTPDESLWLHHSLPEQFIDTLINLEYYLQGHQLPHYFVPEVNLLRDVSPDACRRLTNFIQDRIGKEKLHTLLVRNYESPLHNWRV